MAYFYEFYRQEMGRKAGLTWPAWDELDTAQARAWMLALAASLDMSVRLGDAVAVMGDS